MISLPMRYATTSDGGRIAYIMAAGFFVAHGHVSPAFVLVIIAHERRRVVNVAVTDHPTSAWTARLLGREDKCTNASA